MWFVFVFSSVNNLLPPLCSQLVHQSSLKVTEQQKQKPGAAGTRQNLIGRLKSAGREFSPVTFRSSAHFFPKASFQTLEAETPTAAS